MAAALAPRVRRGYALGSVATGTFGTVPGLLLLPYLTDTIGVTAALAGVIVFVPKAWDVVLNPIAGRISDRAPVPRRRPFLLRGGLLLAVFFALLFAGPTGSQLAAVAWVLVLFLACASAYAFFQVPYVAMPAEMTDDYGERTRLMTWRVAVLALAILVSGASAPAVVDAFDDEATGHRVMGVFVAALIVIGVVGAWRGTRDAPERPGPAAEGTLREQLRVVATEPDFRALLLTFVIQAVGVGTMLAGVAYMADDVLLDTGAATILFVCFVGPALLVTPVWERYSRTRSKRSGYAWASVLMAAGMFLVWVVPLDSTGLLYAAAGLTGVGYAGAQVFPMAMLPDAAAHDARRTGENRVGVYTGVWTAGETLGLALGPAVFAAVIALGGYRSGDTAVSGLEMSGELLQVQSGTTIDAIRLGFGLLPAVLVLASLLLLRRYRLDDEVHHDH